MSEVLKQRAIRVSDADWAAHTALAEKVGKSASELVVVYIKRAIAVANGESVVEADPVPAEYASTLRRRGQRDTSAYGLVDAPERAVPGPPPALIRSDVPLLGTFERGPMQKGVKREKSK